MSIYFRGFIIGISIAAPVGPIGLLCIRRTLADGRLSGFVSGLGAASADAVYGVVAGFGLTFLSSFLIQQQIWFRVFGGAFLCYLGVRTMISSPGQDSPQVNNKTLASNYFSIFILTLTNPMTILSFVAIFAGLGLAEGRGDYRLAIQMVLGVFSGSALWWLMLSFGVGIFRERVTPLWLLWINRAAGVLILGFGLAAILSAV